MFVKRLTTELIVMIVITAALCGCMGSGYSSGTENSGDTASHSTSDGAYSFSENDRSENVADGVADEASDDEETDIEVGFSQLGAESDWRTANTDSILAEFDETEGFTLIYENGQQKQTKQMTSIRRFIQQSVDYIILAPVTETGWENVLSEARDADIPVIIVDRRVDVEDETLFTSWVGSDFYIEGRKACEWLKCFFEAEGIDGSDVNIAHVQGTTDSTAQKGRSAALDSAVMKYGWNIVAREDADFTEALGKEVVSRMLEENDSINVIYCENDNEALGALEAIDEAGLTAGTDIKNGEILVISFDGVKREAMEEVISGRIACIVECNPNQGARIRRIIEQIERGETPDKYSYMSEGLFSNVDSFSWIMVGGKTYQITTVSEDLLELDSRWAEE